MAPRGRQIVKESPATAVRRKKKLRKFIVVSALVVLGIAGLSLASRVDKLAISKVVLEGATIVEEKDVKAIVDETIAGSYVWLFSKRNVLIYPRKKVARELLDKEKRIETLFLTIENNTELHIRITERGGKYLWCGEDPEAVTTYSNCFFLDDTGYIFDEAPYFSDNVYFKFYGKRKEIDAPIIGSHLVEASNFDQLVKFANTVRTFGVTPRGIVLSTEEDNELLLEKRGHTKAPRILFAKDADLIKIANTLGSALAGEPLKTSIKDNYEKLQYLDVRFANKVFYKFEE
jgi:hypothetical protein